MKNSLGLHKKPEETRVVVAMSGGVDSSVVAAMLADEGYDVIGVTLQLYDYGEALRKKGACCAGQDIHDARLVAEQIGIPHYVLNYESRFRESVMEEFADSYLNGETPIPCVRCNQTVKFSDLLSTAHDLNADVMATGHYVQRLEGKQAELHRGVDSGKDQSYFLFATTQEQINFLRFPLGHLHKDQTRALAQRYGLAVEDKPDSQDICFVPQGGYAEVVKKLRPEASRSGEIVHCEDGRVLGRHQGIVHYTIGQRRGIGVAAGEPLYVVKLDPEANRVIVGPREQLATHEITLQELNWLGDQPLNGAPLPVEVKYRSVGRAVAGELMAGADGKAIMRFAEPQYGVSPGQACVIYDNQRVLGGGWIARHR